MISGTGGDFFAVQDIDIPSQFVVLSVVDRIAKKNTEIKRRLIVDGVDRLDGGIKDLGRIANNRLICRRKVTA